MPAAGSNPPPSSSRPPLAAPRRWAFRVAAVAIGLAPLVALEVALRALGIAAPASGTDSLAGFSHRLRLFERVDDRWQTIRSREPFFQPQSFAAVKPANGFRVFAFGGSTVYGHPYLADTAFPKWLEIELAATHPGRRIEAVNCGGISYASYRLAPIVREVLQYQPDLIVMAMGHNDFLEDRTYQPLKTWSDSRRWWEDRLNTLRLTTLARSLFVRPVRDQSVNGPAGDEAQLPAEVRARLDERTGYASYHRDEEWRRQVTAQFEDNFRGMIAACRAAKVPVLIVTLGSNLRDCPPFKSEHRAGLGATEELRWQAAFDAGTAAEVRDVNAALTHYQAAAKIDGQHALLAYRMARAYDRLGQADMAREHFLLAKELDVCPLRMVERVYEVQHQIAAETQTPLVDARRLIEALSPQALPGNDQYLDHVHPTVAGHQRIAQAIAAKLAATGLIEPASSWPAARRRAAYREHLQALPASYFPNGSRRVEWLEKWAKRERLREETAPADARGFLHQGCRLLDLGDEAGAWAACRTAIKLRPELLADLVQHADELAEEGRPTAAAMLMRRLAEMVSDDALKQRIEATAGRYLTE